jgi:hypothetical protein
MCPKLEDEKLPKKFMADIRISENGDQDADGAARPDPAAEDSDDLRLDLETRRGVLQTKKLAPKI